MSKEQFKEIEVIINKYEKRLKRHRIIGHIVILLSVIAGFWLLYRFQDKEFRVSVSTLSMFIVPVSLFITNPILKERNKDLEKIKKILYDDIVS